MDQKLEASQMARDFLMKQIDRAKINLEKTEEELNRFAKQAGIVDYDVESYYTTITMAVMSSLEQKGIIRKLPHAQGSRLHRSTVRIFYQYVRSWFR